MKTVRWQDTWFLDIREAVSAIGCSWEEMNSYIDQGLVRLSRLSVHKRRRVVHTQDVVMLIGELEYRRYAVPIVNLPARTGMPNCILHTPAIRPRVALPVPVVPTKQYFVYALRRPPNGYPFYVGKGTGNRPYEHLSEAARSECHCRKCQIIQLIHKMRREVLITYEYETNDPHDALRHEQALIREWCSEYELANRQGNPYYKRALPHPPAPALMALAEWETYLDRMVLTAKERAQRIAEWREIRIEYLQDKWRALRRRQLDKEAAEIDQELSLLLIDNGDAFQLHLPLDLHPRRQRRRA